MKAKFNISHVFAVIVFVTGGIAQAQNAIAPGQLPANAQKFVKSHFASQSISYAEQDRELFDNEYEVKLANGTEIEFDAKGKWKSIDGNHNPIPVTILPKAVAAHILQNHAQQKVVQAERKSWGYEVELLNGAELEFNNSGKFLRLDE